VVRQGTEDDLPHFFALMLKTCSRQSVSPSPGSLDALRLLWRVFARTDEVQLWIAECADSRPAAQLNLLFGGRMTLWKKGWDGSHREWHSNEVLEAHAIEWANAHGYRVCDFCAIDLSIAKSILDGRSLSRTQATSRDAFNLGFGGVPKLLPPALLYVPNPVLRWVYRGVGATLLRTVR
jgi:hypothetical protein